MEKRLEKYYEMWDTLPKKTNTCFTNKGLFKYIYVDSYIGSGLFGDVYSGSFKNGSDVQVQQDVFKMKKKTKQPTSSNIVLKTTYASKSHMKEAYIAEEFSKMVYKNICPHFPLSYGFYICKTLRFRGSRGTGVYKEAGDWSKRIKSGSGVIQLSEHAGIPFWDFLERNPTAGELNSAIAQVTIASLAMRKYVKVHHSDLYFNNVTMMSVKKPVVFRYIINKREYNIYVKRWYPIIIDYGQSYEYEQCEPSADMFMFLSDFSQSGGVRPKVSSRGIPVVSLSGIQLTTRSIIVSMLKKVLLFYNEIDTDEPHKEWLSLKYTTTDALLYETFNEMFKKRIPNTLHVTFRI